MTDARAEAHERRGAEPPTTSISYAAWLLRHMQLDDVAACVRRNGLVANFARTLREARWENDLRTHRSWRIDDRNTLVTFGGLVGIDDGSGSTIWCLSSEPDAAIPAEVLHAVIATRKALQVWRLGGELPEERPWLSTEDVSRKDMP